MLAVVFVIGIAAPLVAQALGSGDDQAILSRELRVPTPAPSLPSSLESWRRFPRDAENWYGEQFGFRDELLYSYQWMKLYPLNECPVEHLRIGPEDWIFSNSAQILHSSRGAFPLTPEELATWREAIVARRDWLKARGIDYAMALMPGKSAVYPEQLPPALRNVATSRRDQFVEDMRLNAPDVQVIDVLPQFIAAKVNDTPSDHLYFPLGLHWTPRGALVGYRAVMDALPERYRSVPNAKDSDFKFGPGGRGDDFSTSFLVEGRFDQDELTLDRIKGQTSRLTRNPAPDGSCWFNTWQNSVPGLPNAVFLRDSFGVLSVPLFAQHFGTTTDLLTLNFTPSVIEATNPDIVIELYIDHTLTFLTPHAQRTFDQSALVERFVQMKHVLLTDSKSEDVNNRIVGLRGAEVGYSSEGVRVPSNGTQAVALPNFTYGADPLTILRLEITAPAATYITLYYPMPGASKYREKQSSQIPLQAGRQSVLIALPPQRVDEPIGLMPGCAPGEFVIHDYEVRAGKD